jgi:hypothetical protein
MLPFEIASLVLLAAMVGAIYLARETTRETGSSVSSQSQLVKTSDTERQSV